MAKATIQDVPRVFIKNPKLLEQLRSEFGRFYDQENKPIRIYDSQLQKFNERIHSPEINIDPKLTPKELGIKFEEWFELINNVQTTTTEIPQYEAQTTTTGLDLETKIEQSEKRERQSVDIRSREKQTIDDFIENYQKKIKEIKTAQSEFEDKAVYAKVEVDPKDDIKKEQLEAEQQKKIEHYENLVKQEKFETAKQELAAEIEQKAEKELLKQGITKEEIKNIARETASEAIEILSHKNENTYTPPTYQTIILATVATDTTILPKIVSSKAAELVKSSANNVSAFRIQPEVLARSILTTAFGDQFTTVVLGVDPSKIKISITNTLPQNLEENQLIEYREVRLSEVNNHQIDIYQGQINVLNAISDKGREIATGYVQSNITGFLSRKIESLPAGSIIKKLASTPEMQAVLFAKFGVGNPVTWEYANPVLMRVMGQNQLAGAFFSTVSKITSKPLVTAVSGKVAGQVATQVAVKKGFGALIGKVIGVFAGTPAGPAGWIAGLAIGEVAGRAIQNIWSKVKIWLKENKDVAAPAVGVGTAFFIAPFFGAGPAVVGGVGAFALFGGSVAGLATGAFGILGLIGRSVGIAIATPVIVTLLVLPPLIAFIMLVINNSAYVVPPRPLDPSSGTVGSNIKIECTEEKGPVGVEGPNSTSPIGNRAWEIAYDLYQGFWCYWNRPPPAPSPYDQIFPNDTIKYPPDYSSSFDYEYYFREPNPQTWTTLQLFWCTYLVIRSYQYTNNSMEFGGADTNTQFMMNHFKQLGRFISAEDATPDNIPPGSAIFFHVASGHEGANHVGVVYSVNKGGMVFIESNNAVKSQSVSFKYSGTNSCTPLCLKNATPEECGCYNTTSGIGNIGSGSGQMVTLGFGLP